MHKINKVTLVSDGIVIEFDDNTICYFPAKKLHEHISYLEGQILLNHDPSFASDYKHHRMAADEVAGEDTSDRLQAELRRINSKVASPLRTNA